MPLDFSSLEVPAPIVDMIRALSAARSPFFESRAVLFEETSSAGQGGNFIGRRFTAEDAAHNTPITGDALSATGIGAHKDTAPVLRRARPRRIVDGEGAAQGGLLAMNPTQRIIDSTAAWWTVEWDLSLLACLAGAFGSGGPLEATHLHDISAAGSSAVKLTHNATVDAGSLVGDAANGLTVLVAHSRVVADLVKEAGARTLAVPVGGAPFLTDVYVGRARVVVSDRCPVAGDLDDAYAVFTSFLLSEGCIWTSVQQALSEYAAVNPAIPSIDVTQTEHRTLAVGGLSAAPGMPANPTNEQLATAANWQLTVSPMSDGSRKSIGVVAVKTNASLPA